MGSLSREVFLALSADSGAAPSIPLLVGRKSILPIRPTIGGPKKCEGGKSKGLLDARQVVAWVCIGIVTRIFRIVSAYVLGIVFPLHKVAPTTHEQEYYVGIL